MKILDEKFHCLHKIPTIKIINFNRNTLRLVAFIMILMISSSYKAVYADQTNSILKNPEYDIIVQSRHTEGIMKVCYSSDGKYIISAGRDAVKIWTSDGILIRNIYGHSHNITDMDYNSKMMLIASYSDADGIKFWNISGELLGSIKAGEDESIASIAFSKCGRYFITIKNEMNEQTENFENLNMEEQYDWRKKNTYGVINIYDIPSLKKNKEMKLTSGRVTNISFSNNGKYILTTSGNSAALWTFSGQLIRIFETKNKFDTMTSAIFSENDQLIIGSCTDHTINVWNINGNKIISITGRDENDMFNSTAISRDNKTIISGGFSDSIKVWDISGRLIKSYSDKKKTYMTRALAFSPNTDQFVAGNDDCELSLYSNDGKYIKTFGKDIIKSYRLSVNHDLTQFASSDFKNIKLYESSSGKLIRIIKGDGIIFSPDGKRYITKTKNEDNSTISIYSTNGILINSFAVSNGNILSCNFKGSEIAYNLWSDKRNDNYPLIINQDGKIIKKFNSEITLSPDWDYYAVIDKKNNMLKIFSINGQLVLKIINKYLPPNADKLVFSPDGKNIIFEVARHHIAIVNCKTGEVKYHKVFDGIDDEIGKIVFHPDGKSIFISMSGNTSYWNPRYYGIRMFNMEGELLAEFNGHTNTVSEIRVAKNNLISCSLDGTIRIWDIATKNKLMYVISENNSLMFTDDGLWNGTSDCGSMVAMVKGMDAFGIDQFAIRNNRPDLILERMGLGNPGLIENYREQYKKRMLKMDKLYGIKESDLQSDLHVPKAEILKADRKDKNLTLSIKMTDSLYDIVSYNVYVNDVPKYTNLGKQINHDREFTVTDTIELSAGDNKIEVSCLNSKGAESYRALTYANYDGKVKGDLYFIGFGVSDYNDPSLKLRYAENDVFDLSKKFSSMKNDYNNINVKTYTGKDVTPEKIKSAKELLKNAGVDDTVVLFISGHGIHDSDKEKTYYYLTQNTDLKNLKATAADFGTIEDILAGINPRKKLFLMDTCDSGELYDLADRKTSAYDGTGHKGIPRTPKGIVLVSDCNRGYFDKSLYIYNDLFRRTGSVVFSSSMGGEASWEYDSLQNGAFTEAILEGLSGSADSDKNGRITIEELQNFVSKEVVKFTENKQHPVIDRDNISVKFDLPVR